MEVWEVEEHEVAYSWLLTFRMWPGNGVLGSRRARSGLQLAPVVENVAREWSSENTKSTKCVTVASGYPKCGPGMEFWEHEEHEVCDCCIRLFTMWPGNGVLGGRRARSVRGVAKNEPGVCPAPPARRLPNSCPDPPVESYAALF